MREFGYHLSQSGKLYDARKDGGGAPAAPVTVSAMFMGQSEIDYILNASSFYRQVAQPVPGNGNLVIWGKPAVSGNPPVKVVVNAASVAAGQVNPAMAAMSAFLAYVSPGKVFVVGDAAVPGTGRYDLADDTTDGSDSRAWIDFPNVAAAVVADTGAPVGTVIECWYNADASLINTFATSFWPFYFKVLQGGGAFTLGSTQGGRTINHCLWDASVAPNLTGAGVFARSTTKWSVLTPMPFLDAPVSPSAEMAAFSSNGARLIEPARQTVIDLVSQAESATVGLTVGPSAHIARFGGTSSEIHPDVGNSDGQVLFMWPFALALLRSAGYTIGEPVIVAVEGPSDGSYVDLLVSLPNGGLLKTLRSLRGGPAYSGTAPHRQAVTGVEVFQAGVRHPVYNLTETTYPQSHRGTVVIQSAFETHVTYGRVGRVRVTPEVAFSFGATVAYLMGQATASLVEPRDFFLYPDFLIEHIPGFYDATATYPFEGVAVRPLQAALNIPVAPPAFTARSAHFDGASGYKGSGLSVPATTNGVLSVWFKNSDTAWGTTLRRIFQARLGSTTVMDLYTNTSGRVSFRMNNASATDIITFYSTTTSTQFAVNTWYHVLIAWDATTIRAVVNGVLVSTTTILGADMAGGNLTQIGVGAQTNATTSWVGDIGHFYVDVHETLDITVPANVAKFLNVKSPANVGSTGTIPTGTTPEWYYDGTVPAWSNQGSASNVSSFGALTPGATPLLP